MENALLDVAMADSVDFAEVKEEVLATAMSTITWSIMPEPSK
jgi:hypothetical protein